MGTTLLEDLASIGVDTDGVMERFLGKQDLMEKFLFRFIKDNTFEELKKAIEEKNVKVAYECSHALKGLSGNLGLDPLYKPFCKITDIFRAGSMDNYESLYAEITKNYETICGVIEKHMALSQ